MVWPLLMAMALAGGTALASKAGSRAGDALFGQGQQGVMPQQSNPMQNTMGNMLQQNIQKYLDQIGLKEIEEREKGKQPIPLMDMPNLYQPLNQPGMFQSPYGMPQPPSLSQYPQGGLYGGR